MLVILVNHIYGKWIWIQSRQRNSNLAKSDCRDPRKHKSSFICNLMILAVQAISHRELMDRVRMRIVGSFSE